MNSYHTNQKLKMFFQFLQKNEDVEIKDLQKLEELMVLKTLKARAALQEINTSCRTIYFVIDGIARIFYIKDDTDITEYFAFPNDLIIRADSLFNGVPTRKGIETVTETTFVTIAAEPLFGLFHQHPTLEKLFNALIRKSYVETLQRLEQLQFHTAEERYRLLLATRPEIIQYIPLKHVASYLGITQVSLSRIRKKIG